MTSSIRHSEALAEQILDRFENYEDQLEPWFEFRLEAEEARREAAEEVEALADELREELADHYEELAELREEMADEDDDPEFTAADLDAAEAYLGYLSDMLESAAASGTLTKGSPIAAMIDDDFSFEEGDDGCDDIEGSATGDFLRGLGGADMLFGKRGADRLDGGGGNDRLDGGKGADVLLGGGGRDKLDGAQGSDRLDGGAGTDVLKGGAQDDVLIGGGGRDKLHGGEGSNVLSGGSGGDTFVFKRAWDGDSTVTDYNSGEGDRLKLCGVRIESLDLVGNDVLVELSNGGTIAVSGTDLSDFLL